MKQVEPIKYRSLEVNLLPASAISFAKQYRPLLIGAGIFLGLLFALVITTIVTHSVASSNEREIQRIQVEINALQQKIEQSNVLGSVSDYVAISETLQKSQPSLFDLQSKINELMLDGMSVTSMEITQAEQVNFNASFASSEVLIRFMKWLQSSESFEVVSYSGFSNVPATTGNNQGSNAYAQMTQVNFELKFIPEATKGD